MSKNRVGLGMNLGFTALARERLRIIPAIRLAADYARPTIMDLSGQKVPDSRVTGIVAAIVGIAVDQRLTVRYGVTMRVRSAVSWQFGAGLVLGFP